MNEDMEYVNYFVRHNELNYAQLCVADSNGMVPIEAPSVEAVPTFVIVDSNGNLIEQKNGITDIDLFIDKLYSM